LKHYYVRENQAETFSGLTPVVRLLFLFLIVGGRWHLAASLFSSEQAHPTR